MRISKIIAKNRYAARDGIERQLLIEDGSEE
jgi:hypothetical protein